MVDHERVSLSKEIQRRTGKTFHVATRLLPEEARRATYVLYAFFRIADEVVDDPDPGPGADQRDRLEEIREAATGERETDEPVLQAVREVCDRHDIPDREIDEFVDSMAMDVDRSRYATHGDLETYLRGSSVSVAYMMLAVMDPEEPETARPHAAALGKAFQLTNFLRDVREDVVDYDRIYLPTERLAAFGVTESQVEELAFSGEFADLMEAELRRTEELYREGVAGIEYLPRDCQFAVLLSAVLYADHHRLIRERGYDVLSATPSLSMARRLWLVAKTGLHWLWTRDPEAAFYRASVVPRTESGESTEADVGTPSGSGAGGCRLRGLLRAVGKRLPGGGSNP